MSDADYVDELDEVEEVPLSALGEVGTPSVADLFVARMQGEKA